MQTEKKIYIAFAILLVLGGGLYLQSKKSTEETLRHAAPSLSAELPQIKLAAEDVDKVTKLAIKNADKEEVVLEKREDKWWVVKPIEAIANQQNVKSTLDNLKALSVKDSINATPQAPSMYKEYDLEADKAVHVSAFKGDDKTFDAYFGKSGSRGQMARTDAKPGIWIVNGYSSYQFTRALKDWREKQIFKFEDANVVSVALKNENGEYSFSKNDDTWSASLDGKPLKEFDPEKIKDMLRAYRALNAEDFGDGKSDSDTGLNEPAATMTITLKDNAGTHKLAFGKTSSGSSRFARKEGEKGTFVIGSWASDWAVAKPEKFQKPADKGDAGADGGKGDGGAGAGKAPPGKPPMGGKPPPPRPPAGDDPY